MIVTKSSDNSIKSFEDLKDRKSAQSATSNWGKDAKAAGAQILVVDGLAQSLELIKQGRAEATINDKLAVLDYFKKHPNSGLKLLMIVGIKLRLPLLFYKGEDALITKFNQVLEALRQDGTLKQISIEWSCYDITQ